MNMQHDFEYKEELDERVVEIARVAKVVKGGRRFQFRVLVVAGDNKGKVGLGLGKANAVPEAMRKASEKARANLKSIPTLDGTIAHPVEGKVSGAHVLLRPATPGTGVIAGGGVRAVLEAVGLQNILTKSLGSANTLNVVRATFAALDQLKDPEKEAYRRGKPVDHVKPFWTRGKAA
jgi:small subunit ribosomal protein S5